MNEQATLQLRQWWTNFKAGTLNNAGGITPATHDDAELAQLILRSEQRRFAILTPLLTGLTALVALFGVVAHIRGVLPPGFGWMFSITCAGCAYEWLTRRMLARGVRQPKWRSYLHALVELSVPASLTLLVAVYTNPVNAISGSASYTYFLFILLSSLSLDFRLSVFTGTVAALAHVLLGVLFWTELEATFPEGNLVLGFRFLLRALTFALGGVVAGFVGLAMRKSLIETVQTMRERERVTAMFGQHVSPGVVHHLLTHPREEGSKVRTVCVLVLDIRNFTTFSEKHSPDEVVELLNGLWSFMVRAVNENHGFVNKFLGDGFLAVFGAPIATKNDCQNALTAARRIMSEFDERKVSGQFGGIEVGMAVHAGEAIVGNIGSAERKEFTVIGDFVNVAFRLEALNKDFQSRLLVSERVRRAVDLSETERTVRIHVRGREESLGVSVVA